MNRQLSDKFQDIVFYFGKYRPVEEKELQEISILTDYEFEPKGGLRLNVWLATNDFFDAQDDGLIRLKSQTVFVYTVGLKLTFNEVYEMFQFALMKLLDHKPPEVGGEVSIGELHPSQGELTKDGLREQIKNILEEMPRFY